MAINCDISKIQNIINWNQIYKSATYNIFMSLPSNLYFLIENERKLRNIMYKKHVI